MIINFRKEIQSKFNGTAKEYTMRDLIYSRIADVTDVKIVEYIHQSELPNKVKTLGADGSVLIFDYLRFDVFKQCPDLIEGKIILYRAHHFETLHKIENLYCEVVARCCLRKWPFGRSFISEMRNIISCFILERKIAEKSDLVLSVSADDARLMTKWLGAKAVHFPYGFNREAYEKQLPLDFKSAEQRNAKPTILWIGAESPSPNVNHSFHSFVTFMRTFGDVYAYQTTGKHKRYATNRSSELYRMHKALRVKMFEEALDLCDMVYLGSLYGRGIKTKIYDIFAAGKPIIIETKFVNRLHQYKFDLEFKPLGKDDNYTIVHCHSSINHIMKELASKCEHQLREILILRS